MTLKEFKDNQLKYVLNNKDNYLINPITGWIDSKHLEASYIRNKYNKNL